MGQDEEESNADRFKRRNDDLLPRHAHVERSDRSSHAGFAEGIRSVVVAVMLLIATGGALAGLESLGHTVGSWLHHDTTGTNSVLVTNTRPRTYVPYLTPGYHPYIPYPGNGFGPTMCADGTMSHSAGRGTCSWHGGVSR